MKKYEIGDLWWVMFPYQEVEQEKHRPAIVIDDENIAILGMYVTTKDKENPYSIKLDDWQSAGLPEASWTRIDKIVRIEESKIDKKIGSLSERDLTKILQLVAEIQLGTKHKFSLLAIKGNENKFLLRFDKRWNCWLFPYVRSTENDNKANVDSFAGEILKQEVMTNYVCHTVHCKYSQSDQVYKIYHHNLYKVELDEAGISFEADGKNYKWMSISEMEKDSRIMEVNDDIVSFVKSKC